MITRARVFVLPLSMATALAMGCGSQSSRGGQPDAGGADSNDGPEAGGDVSGDVVVGDANDASTNQGCGFDVTYMFWDDGGERAFVDRSTLGPARTYLVARDHFINAPPSTCSRQLTCSDPAGVDVDEIQLALAHPDVVAALSLATNPFYGTDPRPIDGTVFMFQRESDQHGFTVGRGSVPPGLGALVDLLHALQSETVATPACANL